MGDEREAVVSDVDATYKAIGRFIVASNYLEDLLRFCLRQQIKLNYQYADTIITHDFALLCTAILTVFSNSLHESDMQVLKTLISECRSLNDDRVKVVHGSWNSRSGGHVQHVSRNTLRSQYWGPMTGYLFKRSEAAFNLGAKVQLFFWKFIGEYIDKTGRKISIQDTNHDGQDGTELSAFHDGGKVGILKLHWIDDYTRKAFDSIFVESNYRRAGIGRELIRQAFEYELNKPIVLLQEPTPLDGDAITDAGLELLKLAQASGWMVLFTNKRAV